MPQLVRKDKPHNLKYLSMIFKNKILENTNPPNILNGYSGTDFHTDSHTDFTHCMATPKY